MTKSKRSAGAKKAAKTRQGTIRANKAVTTTTTSEEFCAAEVEKMNGGKSILHGAPDFININNKKGIFFEVKPYLQFNHVKKFKDWRVVSPARRMLRPDQLKTFKELIKGKQQVWIIYYNKEIWAKNNERYTIHKDNGKKKNPRKVTKSMLKDRNATDPHLEYFNGHVQK